MDRFLIYDTPNICDDAQSYMRSICFTREDCNPTCLDFAITKCEDKYNCNLGQCDYPYFNPYVDGDLLQFQLRFVDDYNVDEENPVDGWGTFVTLEICDENGTVVYTDADAPRKMVGWSGDYSYQLIEIDTTGLPDCWSAKFQAFDTDGMTGELCSEDFQKTLCEETIEIEGKYSCEDICGNYYGLPEASVGDVFQFSNKWRYWGNIINSGCQIQKDIFNDVKATSVEFVDVHKLQISKLIPSYAKNMLLKMHLAAEEVCIDDMTYNFDTASITRAEGGGNMFWVSVDATNTNDLNFSCNC